MSSVVDGEDGEEGGSSSSATWSATSLAADLDLSDDERRKVRLVRLPNHLKPVLKAKSYDVCHVNECACCCVCGCLLY